jgi:hypothetical protein
MRMGRRIGPWALVVALAALGGCFRPGGGDPGGESGFKLVVSDTPVEVAAAGTVIIQLMVLGADGGEVTVTAADLPAFASLDGLVLTLSPGYDDAGDHEIDLVATAGGGRATATLRVHVTRDDTPPMWLPQPMIDEARDVGGDYPWVPTATMGATICDAEGDDITFQVEVVAQGGTPTGVASYQQTISFSVTPPLDWYDQPCAAFQVPLTGLPDGAYDTYGYAFDSLGLPEPYGWVPFGGFTLAAAGPPDPVPLEPVVPPCGRTGADPGSADPFARLQYGFAASWGGIMSNPWFDPVVVLLTFTPDGHYTAHCLDATGAPDYGCLAFYYGDDHDSPYKRYELTDLTANGDGWGTIDITWGDLNPSATTRGSLEHIVLSADLTGLQFEFWDTWTGARYGPVKYDLDCIAP